MGGTVSDNDSAAGIIAILRAYGEANPKSSIFIAATTILIVVLSIILSPKLESGEPPIVRPTIPIIGHIVGLIRHQAKYHLILRRKTHKPIATLPMLGGKMYAIWDPSLIAAGLRNKNLSMTPHAMATMKGLCQLRDETDAIIRGSNGEAAIIDGMLQAMPPSLAGSHLRRVNEAALSLLGEQLNEIQDLEIPNLWLWVRGLLTSVTGKAMFGKEDPFSKDANMERFLWDFEADFPKLVFNVMPSVIAPTGHRSRAQFQEALKKYYSAHHDLDPSVSQFVQTRSKFIRDAGIPDDEVARLEIMLPFAAIVNTVPSMFWLICFILPKPDLVARLRPEVENLIKRDGNEVTINTGAVEEQCPLLMSCYRETLRVTNHQVSTRTVLEDTVISDGNGNSYLLKKDVVVQMSIGTSHAIEEYWGPDVSDFNPDRFLQFSNRKTGDSSGPGSPKAIRAAFQPFGGGHHLCPGRNFAFAEMIALITTILLGYEMDPLDGDWVLPDTATWSLVDAITKPVATSKGIKLHLYRREGWEHVTWKYEV